MITISHTHADGTMLDGSRKGDGVYELLKGLRDNWRYFPSIRAIGIGQSRDKSADSYKIKRAAEALRAGGHEVTVEVDESQRRDFATVEAERYERAEDRAERMAERSAAATGNAERMWSETDAVYGALNGQPILVGHRSERRHRNLLDKTHAKEGRAVDEFRKGKYLAERATAAERYKGNRENVPTTLRRIAKLEAEARRTVRTIAGDTYSETPGGEWLERLTATLADTREELAYWREHVAAAEAAGVKVWSSADFAKGDFVKTRGHWYEILRVNPKSLTVPAGALQYVTTDATRAYSWNDKVPYDDVSGKQTAAEMAALMGSATAIF